MIKSIWCEGVTIPKDLVVISYQYISGGNYPDYEWNSCERVVMTPSKDSVMAAVEEILNEIGDEHHIFIEAFKSTDRPFVYTVSLGS